MQRIFLVGYMGSGKTTMGKLLAQQLGLSFLDLDAYIEGKHHRTISQIFDKEGESGFREIEKKCLHEVADFENVVVATGGGAPCFFDNMTYMNQKGITLYLKMTINQLSKRLSSSKAGVRPLIANKNKEELYQFISEGLAKREDFYLMARHVISGSDEEIIRQIKNFNP
ncbi:Shikimate kinase [bioreactor metagenome]|uniref:Shikimate kinase n=1 Tax=bioreactor metagenome TaxID=1076179 RepID=A0A645F5H3_9ZZZZ|nr:shikimate kinase [Paludibacter sp.]